jgi:arylsulfatase A-like enzyme
MQAVEARGLLESTVVVFLSDHGDLMGDHWLINKGPFLFEGLVRVPTIWRIPGVSLPGRVTSAQVSAADFCPTVLDLTGVPVPDGTQGKSYRAVLEREQDTFRDWIYVEYDESYLEDRLRHLRSSDWALTYFVEHEYGMLYDLRADPGELANRWDDPEYRQVRQQLLTELLGLTSAADDWLPAKRCHA